MGQTPQDNVLMKIGNMIAQWNTNSNAATPLIFFFLIVGIFSLIAQSLELLVGSAVVIGLPLIYAFLFADHKLRDSRHSIAWRKLDLQGHKGDENVIEGEVVQPVLQARANSARAQITRGKQL